MITSRCVSLNTFWLVIAVILLLAGCAEKEASTEFPQKAIKLVVPFKPGGGSDTLARILQEGIRAGTVVDQSTAIINVPGAGGTIGSHRVKNARPDGYTILNLHDAIFSAKYSGRCLYGPEVFESIAATGSSGTIVAVKTDSRFVRLDELLAEAAQKPNTLTFGANTGAPSHFVGLQLEATVPDASFRFVPAGGGAARFAAMAGGHLDATIFSISEYLQFRDGGIRALAYLGDKRHVALPDLPTGKEHGVDVISATIQYWWAPKGTPPERVRLLADMLEEAMASNAVKEQFQRQSIDPLFLRGDELRDFLTKRDAEIRGMSIRKDINVPSLGIWVLFGLGAFGLLMLFVRRGQTDRVDETTPHNSQPWIMAALVTAYVIILSISMVPFWLSTSAFAIAAGLLLAGSKRAKVAAVLSGIAVTITVTLLFRYVLFIDLPGMQ